VEEPYGIKMWCLGNEMDGEWQMGHKTAYEYGRLAAETGKAMKVLDPEIELIACGSSLSSMPTCPEWDLTVMEETYDVADYIALHQYYGGQEKGTKAFLAQTLDMEEYIKTFRAAAQIVKKKKHSAKDMKFSVDEWGIWAVPSQNVKQEVSERPWQIAPPISEQIYTLEDALLFAGMQMVMLRNADAVKIACQSLLTNVSACIMTEPGGGLWFQTIYYPFYYFANYARGTVLACEVSCDTYSCEEFDNAPYLDSLIVWNEAAQELAVFLINKSETEAMDVVIRPEGFLLKEVKKAVVLTAADKKITNAVNHRAVVPQEKRIAEVDPETCIARLAPLSFNMVLIGL
jgi:alpha-N-arabinofuranosidase